MDEYKLEIDSTRRTLNRLKDADADPAILEEYAAELRNLNAIYAAARHAYEAGLEDDRLVAALAALELGEWTFDNVYSFVYDAAIDAELDGRELADLVNETDYAASLIAESAEAGDG